ncbi:MAG: hypothetical protein CM15mP77_2450 [Synechococcus sp.]|nr:MAG: hypothetical protein CM15mP77_2450 [Synechococcus sp.]
MSGLLLPMNPLMSCGSQVRPLMPQLCRAGIDQTRQSDPWAFQELSQYHSSQHHVGVPARLVQASHPIRWSIFFRQHCMSGQALKVRRFSYQDPWLLVVLKPSRLLSQPGRGDHLQDS